MNEAIGQALVYLNGFIREFDPANTAALSLLDDAKKELRKLHKMESDIKNKMKRKIYEAKREGFHEGIAHARKTTPPTN